MELQSQIILLAKTISIIKTDKRQFFLGLITPNSLTIVIRGAWKNQQFCCN